MNASKLTDTVKAAVAYQHSPSVKEALDDLLKIHGNAMEEVNYELSDDEVEATKALETSMNEFDEQVAESRAAVKENAERAAEGSEAQ